MTKKTFLVFRIITTIILGMVVGVSVTYDNWYLPVVVMLFAFAFLYTLKKRVREVIADERDYKVAGRASYLAMTVYTIASAVLGIILFIIGKESTAISAVANTLVFSACFFMLLYSFLFKVYIRKDEHD